MNIKRVLVTAFGVGLLLTAVAAWPAGDRVANSRVHTYYVAADEIAWDYAPQNMDVMMGHPFDAIARVYTEKRDNRIGKTYKKAVYREYTDETFTRLKPRPPEWAHLGILGPVLRGEVGEVIKVVFKNNATKPYSMHPHGVFYDKNSEGSPYADGTSGASKHDDAVPPGDTHVYTWKLPERSGPGPGDLSSIVWLYHSHTNETRDVESGLMGAIIVSARGTTRPDGTPRDVDREFATMFIVIDENQSWYLDQNIQTYAGKPGSVDKADSSVLVVDGYSLLDNFIESNHKYTINGFLYGNGPMMEMKKGERVRWYVITLGFGFNFHTPHWHGNTLLLDKKRMDVMNLSGPALMVQADMIPDNPGIWMLHCHVSDHMDNGMSARFKVAE